MDLRTTYLGMSLSSPLVASASPLSDDIAKIKQLEDAGASAVVLYSLFEEQLRQEELRLHYHTTNATNVFAEAQSFFPEHDEYRLGPEEYLEHIRKAKAAVNIPIIASLNGTSLGGWTEYARKMQQAGADAIELNVYYIPTDPGMLGIEVEQTYLDILKAVKSVVTIPVAMKLSPYFSNMANMAKRLDEAGANGLVLFNRFYQPDIDLEELTVNPNIKLSNTSSMRLPMRWIALLKGRIQADLAATSGIHSGTDVIKMMMVGANVTMLCSTLLMNGIQYLKVIENQVKNWMMEKEYDSIKQMQGSMSQLKTENPAAFERAQYMKAITYYKLA